MKVSRSIVLGALAAGGMVLALGNPASACPSDWGDDDWDDDFLEDSEEVFYGEYDADTLNNTETFTAAHGSHLSNHESLAVDVEEEDNDTSHSIINVFD